MTNQTPAPVMGQRQWIAIALIALAVGAVAALSGLLYAMISGGQADTTKLTLLVIGGAVALVIVIALVAAIYSLLGLTDPTQAMALPEGSIRAVIALLLLVIFAMLAVFFYNGLQAGGAKTTVQNLSETDLVAFLAQHPNAPNLSVTVVADKAADSSAPSGGASASGGGATGASAAANAAPTKPAAKGPTLYNVSYGGANPNADDFAKQLITALGTLLTSVVAFYFGGKTATSAAAAGAAGAAAAGAAGAAAAVNAVTAAK